MSNKLVKHQESKELLSGKQKEILFWICFIILSISFITVWINILLTSKAFQAVHTVRSYYAIMCYAILLPLFFPLRGFVKPCETI